MVNLPGPAVVGSAEPSYDEFKQAVFDMQVANKRAKGKTFYPAVPASELMKVEGRFRMRTEAAQSCKRMLGVARSDLETAKQGGGGAASGVTSIAIHSAYRDYDEDTKAWEKSYKKHYAKTKSQREACMGGGHGHAALLLLVARMQKFKAAPGFSNHSNGTAVDFQTEEGGVLYEANSDQRESWRETWLYIWLAKNAVDYRFKQLVTEEWHWDYK